MAKTPITYYGGKQTMLKHILPLIPKHKVYTETFVGGAAVFFAKEPSEIEVINDINGELMNFYQVAKSNFKELRKLIELSLYSRDVYMFARFVYSYPWHFNNIRRAWAVWVLSKMTFASRIDGSFGYGKTKNTVSKKIRNSIDQFTEAICNRLRNTCIENREAIAIIRTRDTSDTFHFVDPPYIDTDCGHYKGYTIDNFKALIAQLEKCSGKFMLTMFPHKVLDSPIQKNGWNIKEIPRTISAAKSIRRKKIEVIVMNY